MVGNFIGDAVKGRHYKNYPEPVQNGISLHRFIDHYIDNHPVSHQSKMLVAPHYGKFSGVVIDIFYDHFLSINWSRFSNIPLHEFIYSTHDILLRYTSLFPPRVKRYFPFFILNSWMESYTCVSGIESVLERMSKRTSLPDRTKVGIEILLSHYSEFEDHFLDFFPQIMDAIQDEFSIVFDNDHKYLQYLPSA
jgi:acyl carrier protein phosphodiesterase